MSRLFLRSILIALLCGVALPGVSGDPRTVPVFAHWPMDMAVSPNGRYLAAAGGAADVMTLYDFKTGKTRVLKPVGNIQYEQFGMRCYAMTFSPDSRTLANGGAELGGASAINTWDTASGTHLKTFDFGGCAQSLLYTPDGKSLVAASNDNRVRVWNALTGKSVRTIPGPGGMIGAIALSPDGRRVAIGTIVPACFLQIRDLRSGRVLWTKPIAGEGMVSSLAFSPDGATLARGGQRNTIYLHDARTGALRASLSDPVPAALRSSAGSDAARMVKYSADGRFLAGGAPERVVVWSARSKKVILRPDHAGTPFAFLSNSHALAATQSDRPSPHPAGATSYTMRPPRRDGSVALWTLK